MNAHPSEVARWTREAGTPEPGSFAEQAALDAIEDARAEADERRAQSPGERREVYRRQVARSVQLDPLRYRP